MADYNVQMKQYNGTSFDNILPYASQALTLAGGGGATEIIAQARVGLSQFATGSYVGNGATSFDINVGFTPKIVIVQSDTPSYSNGPSVSSDIKRTLSNRSNDSYYSIFWINGLSDSTLIRIYKNRNFYYVYQKCTVDGNIVNFSLKASNSVIADQLKPDYICNISGKKYVWVAFG